MPAWFIVLIVAVPLFVILWRRPRKLPPIEVPSFVRILEPLPGEEGRCLLIWSDPGSDEYRIGMRDGSVQSFQRSDIAEWEG